MLTMRAIEGIVAGISVAAVIGGALVALSPIIFGTEVFDGSELGDWSERLTEKDRVGLLVSGSIVAALGMSILKDLSSKTTR